jgi:pimeloyl-ACP methyl ester carboxylesterase
VEPFTEVRFAAEDGLELSARDYGGRAARESGALPVVCLPGLTRNARDFHALATILSSRLERPRRVVAFDYRGRGGSCRDRNRANYSVPVETRDLATGLTVLGLEHAGFIGTSRGGLLIMALSASRPGAIRAVVLNDFGPVLEGEGLAQIRSALSRMPRPKDRDEAIALQKLAQEAAFPALKPADWSRMALANYREQRGRLVADYDPAIARALSAIDFSRPLPASWGLFDGLRGVPLLAIRGENSKLLSPETLKAMKERHPDCATITVKGQGHAPLLETGDLPARIEAFLRRAEARKR